MLDHSPTWPFQKADIAIDLGTANTRVVLKSGDIVFDQPSVCCFDGGQDLTAKLFAVGHDAKPVIGREVRQLRTAFPLRNGVLVDVAATSELLKIAVRSAVSRRRLRRARVIVGVPTDATPAERRALSKAVVDAGLDEPRLLAEPLLSAIGAGLDISLPRGRMIVDCGAGTTDVVIISLGDICVARSVRGGSDTLEAALIHHLHLKRQFRIGRSSAEQLKIAVSDALNDPFTTHVETKGLDVRARLPRTLSVSVNELRPVFEKYAAEVANAVRTALATIEPDLAHDIFEDGITLTGGAALTALVAEYIEASTGLPTNRLDDPGKTVAQGLAALLA